MYESRRKKKRDLDNILNLPRLPLQTRTANIFSRIAYKINFSNKKGSQSIIPIDILKDEVKKDLLFITSQNVEKTYRELLTHRFPYLDMKDNGANLLFLLVKDTCDEFLVKQYGFDICFSNREFTNSLYIKNLLTDLEILFQVPFYGLIDPVSVEFRRVYYPIYSYASESFIEALIDNLIIEIANSIIYLSITKFSFLYSFRQTLYRSKFLSLRNFERFKNNVIWQLRLKIYIKRPALIYNSSFSLLLLRTNGIYSRVIYANSPQELASLPRLSLLTITTIELRDFLLGRLDELLYLLSKGLRLALTSGVGQFIGLIWRGIIEGLKK